MTYAGFVNKNIVAQLQSLGSNAIGLCGADGNLIQSHKSSSSYNRLWICGRCGCSKYFAFAKPVITGNKRCN